MHYARRMVGRDVEIAAGLDRIYGGASHAIARGSHGTAASSSNNVTGAAG
jgi:hypothetical protein